MPELIKGRNRSGAAAHNNDCNVPDARTTYTVKYNKELVQLTLEEMIHYAEIGMAYDDLKREVDFLRQDTAYRAMKVYAEKNGIGVMEAVRHLLNTVKE